MEKISIFTPTYNRAKCLIECYKSLCNQTSKDFIWLIIDDGSTDNTNELIDNFKNENKINIKYYKKENGGKHTAHNLAVQNCETDYLLILDSDDIIGKNCISILNEKIKLIDNEDNISGIIGNRYDIDTKLCIGTEMTSKIKYASGLELYQKYNCKGDTLRMYKTAILKKYLFPIVKNEKFIYENVVFDKIDSKYKMLIIHEKLYFTKYISDGYTVNATRLKLNNPLGYSISLESSAKYSINFINKFKYTLLYIIWCKKFCILNDYKLFSNKFMYVVAYPFALVMMIFKYPKFFFNIFKARK